MTKRELAELFNVTFATISYAFTDASKDIESIAIKSKTYSKMKEVDFSLEECVAAIKCISTSTPMMVRYLKENYIYRDGLYKIKPNKKSVLPREASRFIWKYQNATGHPHVCVTCGYFRARCVNIAGAKPKPFCNFYGAFIHKTLPKRDIYNDRCDTYTYSDTPPLIFTKSGVYPIDKLFSIKNPLGHSPEEYTSKRQRGEPIILMEETDIIKSVTITKRKKTRKVTTQ